MYTLKKYSHRPLLLEQTAREVTQLVIVKF